MTDGELKIAIEKANVFSKSSFDNKAKIVTALRHNSFTVSFIGDGVNDAPAPLFHPFCPPLLTVYRQRYMIVREILHKRYRPQ